MIERSPPLLRSLPGTGAALRAKEQSNSPDRRKSIARPPCDPGDGGAEGIRTPDPHNAIVVLYQLSYDPIRSGTHTVEIESRFVKNYFPNFNERNLNSLWSLGLGKSLFAFCRAARNVRVSQLFEKPMSRHCMQIQRGSWPTGPMDWCGRSASPFRGPIS